MTDPIIAKRGRFYINPHDTLVGASLRTYGEYAEHEMMLLTHWLAPGHHVIDIGANIGTHSAFFSQAVGTGGKVLAIEAQPQVYDLLLRNLTLNRCSNVTTRLAACGATRGELVVPDIDYGRDGNFGAFSFRIDDIARYLPMMGEGAATKVPMIPLDEIDLEVCHLIKIDAEGMEGEVLAGAAKTIGRFRPVLYLENNNRDASSALIAQLSLLGYACHWHVVSYFREGNFAHARENIFVAALELNLLCLPGERAAECPLPVVSGPDQWLPDDLAAGRANLDDLLLLAEMFGR